MALTCTFWISGDLEGYTRLWCKTSGRLLRTIPSPVPCSSTSVPAVMYCENLGNRPGNSALLLGAGNKLYVYKVWTGYFFIWHVKDARTKDALAQDLSLTTVKDILQCEEILGYKCFVILILRPIYEIFFLGSWFLLFFFLTLEVFHCITWNKYGDFYVKLWRVVTVFGS